MPTDGTTFINPLGLVFTLLMGVLLLALPRRYALVPVIALVCYMTMGERIMVAGLNFTMIRILTLFGWTRIVLRREIYPLGLNTIDKVIILWTIASLMTYTLLWRTSGAFIYRCGGAYDVIGMYFLFRFLLRNIEDVVRVGKCLAALILPLAIAMLLEKISGRNVFAVFGGVPETTVIRDGVLRCQGPFAHPIMAGTFGATVAALFVALWWQGHSSKLLAVLGSAASAVIIIAAGSSGPIMAALSAMFGLAMWPMRKQMRFIRWTIVLVLLALELVMKSHVWFLMARVNIFSGSDGWHRAYLIDRAVFNFFDWWLVGTKSTEAWGYSLWDVTNGFVRQAADGGLVTLILFVAIITHCFRGIGRSLRASDRRRLQIFIWGLGAALLAHVTTYFSVSYFDQNSVNWFLLLAMIATVCTQFLDAKLRIQEVTPESVPLKALATDGAPFAMPL